MNTTNGDYEISRYSDENQETFSRLIEDYGMNGQDVLEILIAWHGTQLMSEEFMDNLLRVEMDMDSFDEEEV